MVMTPQEADRLGKSLGWFLLISLAVAVVLGFMLDEWFSLSVVVAIILVGVIWAAVTLPFAWLMSRRARKKSNQ
jgi:Flp pilus assembly protein TadB